MALLHFSFAFNDFIIVFTTSFIVMHFSKNTKVNEPWKQNKSGQCALCFCVFYNNRVFPNMCCTSCTVWSPHVESVLLLGHVSWLCFIVQFECSQLIVFTVLFWNPQLATSRHCDMCFHLFVRFRSVHCLLYPDTTWCLGSQQVWRLLKDVGGLMDKRSKPAFTAL